MISNRFSLYAGTGVALLSQLLTGLISTMMGASMTRLAPVFGGDITRVALLMSFIAFGRVAAVVPGGIFTDRFGSGLSLSAGTLIYSLFLFFLPRCGQWWLAALLCVCAGAGFGLIDSGVPAFMRTVHSGRYASMISVCGIFFGIGCMLSPFCISIGIKMGFGLAEIYGLFALLALAGLMMPAFIRPGAGGGRQSMEKLPPGSVTKLLLPCAAIFLFCALSSLVNAWCAAFAIERAAMAESEAIMVLTLYGLGSICGNFASSLILRRVHGSIIMLVSPVIALGLWLAIIFIGTVELLPVLFFLLGIFLGNMFSVIMGVATAGAGKRTGTVAGTLAMTAGMGDIASPLIASISVGAFGVYPVFSSGACLAALLFITGAAIRRKYR